ncbi:hypothetical protein [Marinobacter salinexigens]|uniref:hypothetical protein n=1 Tax=Marinobacter salinexigens TaxID=2919747 RepID=UPI00165FEBDE|nr:hypothetical protein [Marinobacter salinexigens]
MAQQAAMKQIQAGRAVIRTDGGMLASIAVLSAVTPLPAAVFGHEKLKKLKQRVYQRL